METLHVTSVHEQCTRQHHAGYRGTYYLRNYFLLVLYLIRSNLYNVTGLFIKTDNVLIMVTLRRVRVTNFYSGKAVSITHSDCVCILTYPASRVHTPNYIVINGLLQYFSTLSLKWHDFSKT